MPTLPPAILHLLAPFAPCFSRRVWPHALVLLAGAILAPGQRTVTAALRVMGLAHDRGLPLPPRAQPRSLVRAGRRARLA